MSPAFLLLFIGPVMLCSSGLWDDRSEGIYGKG